ncbi:hypothetical protein Goklo_020846 [Gossypium klotzschianum]|uniref:Uncharacterized protein n=1 Tax=Gossypium klotzschianum TaxID=34286 RepID=A0A7J8UTE2_9ROSI|nr:hypothetical protein [Gossypium klotzschianum]
MNMETEVVQALDVSWKDKLLGRNSNGSISSDIMDSEDFVFSDGDILKSTVNGIPTIEFSNKIQNILVKNMETTIVVKLLGHNIGYIVLHNRISVL